MAQRLSSFHCVLHTVQHRSSMHAHKLALAQASGQELRAWGSAGMVSITSADKIIIVCQISELADKP